MQIIVSYMYRRLTISRANCFLFQVGNWKNGDSSLFDKTEKDLFLCSGVNACLCACFKHAQTHFTCNKDAF